MYRLSATSVAIKQELFVGTVCRYVSGRTRAAGEINGKSGNLNNALASVYQQYRDRLADIPATELVVVFDADMQPKRDFFTKVLEVMYDKDTALCLTPQVNTCACRPHS